MSFIEIGVEDGIATLSMAMAGGVNTINRDFIEGLEAALEAVLGREDVRGIILASAHKDFCAGADIDMLYEGRDPAELLAACTRLNAAYRRLETCGKPAVAALSGSALGGGYELALACHRRIALDSPRVQVGLPEVGFGVMPGAGGTQRLPRLLGVQAALELLTSGRLLRAPAALELGLVDELAPDREALLARAAAWIRENPDSRQPWDRPEGMVWPAPEPSSSQGRALFLGACAQLYKKTAGAFPAPEVIIEVVKEGTELCFDRALERESRAFARLASSGAAKDMLRTFWYHRRAAARAEGLPVAEASGFSKIGILGAGMMGAGLAFVCASRGYEVVLKDVSAEVLERARARNDKNISRREQLSAAQREELAARIRYTLELEHLEGCDLVIEAVPEERAIKDAVLAETEGLLAPGGIWASNTSALPIAQLASASARPGRFIGLHFFSPVERMPLLEIIAGERTDEETIARCVRFALDLGKLPILVNDGYGFYTSRVFSAYLLEGVQLICEGHDPVLVEWAARVAGMAVPPLKVFDEIGLSLGRHALEQTRIYRPEVDLPPEGLELLRVMIEERGRGGKAAGAGFYDYEGRRRQLWPELAALASGGRVPAETGVERIGRRLLLAQIAQVVACIDEGIIRQPRDAEVGAIFGIGFAPNTGGPLAWIDRQGAAAVVAELEALAERRGDRFAPASVLRRMARRGERFFGG